MIQPAPFSSQQCSKRFNEINFYNKKPFHAVNHNQLCSLEYTDIFMPLIYIPLIYILLECMTSESSGFFSFYLNLSDAY